MLFISIYLRRAVARSRKYIDFQPRNDKVLGGSASLRCGGEILYV